jgi:hypothetical protein
MIFTHSALLSMLNKMPFYVLFQLGFYVLKKLVQQVLLTLK